MNNGLVAAFFVSPSVLAAVALWRAHSRISKLPTGAIPLYLVAVLVLCKAAGALVYAIVLGFFVRWTKPIVQVRLAVFLVGIAISYPVLRMAALFPTNQLVEFPPTFNQAR